MKTSPAGPSEKQRRGGRAPGWLRSASVLGLVAAVGLLAGCDVENPGNILDEDLNQQQAFDALVNGMASDFALGFNGSNSGAVWYTGVLFGDLWAATSGIDDLMAARGTLPQDRHEWANWTNDLHTARWVAEDGVQRMREALGAEAESNLNVAEGLVWAGLANRQLGEIHCQAVFDGGQPQPRSAWFDRAEQHFTDAIAVAGAAPPGADADTLLWAAYGGRAQINLLQGDIADAASDASQVPQDFEWVAHYNDVTQGGRQTNAVWHETHPRSNISVAYTWFRDYYLATDDPRVPSEDVPGQGADGVSNKISQEKYPEGQSNVPLVKWEEMRLIEAEQLIRNNSVPAGMAIINSLRQAADPSLPDRTAANQQEAMQELILERGTVLWLEARRGGDFYRLNNSDPLFPNGYEPANDTIVQRMVANVEAELPANVSDPVLATGRAVCWPFSQTMLNTNPNIVK